MVYLKYEREFVQAQERQLPGISGNFDEALKIEPEARAQWAKNKLSSIFRDGWQSGSKDFGWHRVIPLEISETTASHINDLKALAGRFFSGAEGQAVEASIDVHDDVEVVAHVLLPTQGKMLRRDINLFRGMILGPDAVGVVSAEVKAKIETIGANILFQAEPERKALWLDYEAKGSEAAKLASSLDKIAVMIQCGKYIELGMDPDEFRVYWQHWTLDAVKKKCHPRVAEIYGDVILPEIQQIVAGVDSSYEIS